MRIRATDVTVPSWVRRAGDRRIAIPVTLALLALAVAFGVLALRGEPEPRRPTVVATYQLASSLWGLAPGFGEVWTVDPSRHQVLRIEPGIRRVVARVPVRGEARVAAGAGAVWALAGELFSGEAGAVRLLRIDPATGRVVARIALRTPAGDGFGASDDRRRRGLGRGRHWRVADRSRAQCRRAIRVDHRRYG
jgi:hypothetical protein